MANNEKETVTTDETVDAEAQEVEESTEPVEESTEEAEAQESEETSTEESKDNVNNQVDYKAVAEQERERREKAEQALAKEKFREREEKREQQPESEDDLDKPLTRRELLQWQQDQTKTSQESKVKEIIEANTSSVEEAEAALLMYQNRVVPTGDPEQDAMFAIGGLNAKRMKQVVEEINRANNSKDISTKVATSPQQQGSERPETKISSVDANAIKAAGLVWNGKKGLYVKPLAGGKKFMYYDPKRPSGQKQWVA